jgi:hypothetical protein
MLPRGPPLFVNILKHSVYSPRVLGLYLLLVRHSSNDGGWTLVCKRGDKSELFLCELCLPKLSFRDELCINRLSPSRKRKVCAHSSGWTSRAD